MRTLLALLGSTHLADVALIALLVEAAALALYRTHTGRGPGVREILGVLLPGACLLLAMRSALASAGTQIVGFFLIAALLTHAADLRRRWRLAATPPQPSGPAVLPQGSSSR
jgi:hypothetical protein